jgi:hypothetical protein
MKKIDDLAPKLPFASLRQRWERWHLRAETLMEQAVVLGMAEQAILQNVPKVLMLFLVIRLQDLSIADLSLFAYVVSAVFFAKSLNAFVRVKACLARCMARTLLDGNDCYVRGMSVVLPAQLLEIALKRTQLPSRN